MPGAPGRFHPHYAPESGKVNRQESRTPGGAPRLLSNWLTSPGGLAGAAGGAEGRGEAGLAVP